MTEVGFSDLLGGPSEVRSLAVVGSRTWPEEDFVWERVEAALRTWPLIETIVSGGQRKGVDGWAEKIAETHGLEMVRYVPAHRYPSGHPEYAEYDPQNYMDRNSLIAKNCDALLAFCWQGSNGTMDTYWKASHLPTDRRILYTEKSL